MKKARSDLAVSATKPGGLCGPLERESFLFTRPTSRCESCPAYVRACNRKWNCLLLQCLGTVRIAG